MRSPAVEIHRSRHSAAGPSSNIRLAERALGFGVAGVTAITPMGQDVDWRGGPVHGRSSVSGSPQQATGAAGGGALVLLARPASAAESALVARWLHDGHLIPSALLQLDSPDLARSLDRGGTGDSGHGRSVSHGCRAERGGERRVRWSDVLSEVNPRRPPCGVLAEPDHRTGARWTGPRLWSRNPPQWPRCAHGGVAPARSLILCLGRPDSRWTAPSRPCSGTGTRCRRGSHRGD